MAHNNLKLGLVSSNAHAKFDQILSVCCQIIEQKQSSDFNQGTLLYKYLRCDKIST